MRFLTEKISPNVWSPKKAYTQNHRSSFPKGTEKRHLQLPPPNSPILKRWRDIAPPFRNPAKCGRQEQVIVLCSTILNILQNSVIISFIRQISILLICTFAHTKRWSFEKRHIFRTGHQAGRPPCFPLHAPHLRRILVSGTDLRYLHECIRFQLPVSHADEPDHFRWFSGICGSGNAAILIRTDTDFDYGTDHTGAAFILWHLHAW